jgi:rhamnosyltransferase
MKRAVVIAHHHRNGFIRTDTQQLVTRLVSVFDKVIFVSTNLNNSQLDLLPPNVEVIIRENIGYDFYSYRLGLLSVLNQEYEFICVMNTSVVCLDIEKFVSAVSALRPADSEICGITKSVMIAPHIQSYLYMIPKSVLHRHDVVSWWVDMMPINNLTDVIFKHEVGFSKLLTSKGITLSALNYGNTDEDPSHHNWKELLDTYGIIKIRLLRDNPFHLDLEYVHKIAQNWDIANALNQGLYN